jgi:hypothetical protein
MEINYDFIDDEIEGIENRKPPASVEGGTLEIVEANDLKLVTACKNVLEPLVARGEAYKKKAGEMELKVEGDLDTATELIGQGKKYVKVVQDKAKEHYKKPYQDYKTMLGFQNKIVEPVEAANEILQGKIDNLVNLLEVERRAKEQRAQEEARKLQEKIDKQLAEQAAKEKKLAKKEKREPVPLPPVQVAAPVIPKEIKTRTQHGSLKTKPVLQCEITDLKSSALIDAMVQYCGPAYKKLAMQALKKMIAAGMLGVAGIEGVTVTEWFKGKHTKV